MAARAGKSKAGSVYNLDDIFNEHAFAFPYAYPLPNKMQSRKNKRLA
jgi:hypothetical protein